MGYQKREHCLLDDPRAIIRLHFKDDTVAELSSFNIGSPRPGKAWQKFEVYQEVDGSLWVAGFEPFGLTMRWNMQHVEAVEYRHKERG